MKLQKFDYQIKDNRKNTSFIIVGVLLVALVIVVVLYKSFAVYTNTNSYNIIKGTVGEFTNVPLKISYNLVGEDGSMMSSSEVPSNVDYKFNAEKSSCANGNTINYNPDNNTFVIGDGSEDLEDNCDLYFDFIPYSLRTLYALNFTEENVINYNDPEIVPYGSNGTGIGGWYQAPDNYGTSYYYYNDGNDFPLLVDFDGYSYLIIRINGDGTLRLLETYPAQYDVFNSIGDDNTYLGYFYGSSNSNDYLITHANNSPSKMYGVSEDDWLTPYPRDLAADSIFCNDRTLYKEEYGEPESDDTFKGTGTNTTYYGAYYRLKYEKPSLICERKEDSFTVEETNIGNGKKDYFAGYLSADEVYMTNLLINYGWLGNYELATMSPAYFKNGQAYIFKGVSYDSLTPAEVNADQVLAHVINLRSGIKFDGNGSSDTPYTIAE